MNTNLSQTTTVLLLGGAAGTGKTSLARTLCSELEITHRLGSGFIREVAKSFVSSEENAFLYNYSFRPHLDISPFENLRRQSEILANAMRLCMKRACEEGTSLLIEGVHVIPGLFDTDYFTLGAVLTVESYKQHFQMIQGKTHSKRRISEDDFHKIRGIQEDFKVAARASGWPLIDVGSSSSIADIVRTILENGGTL